MKTVKIFNKVTPTSKFMKLFYEGLGLQVVMGQLMNRKDELTFRKLSFISAMTPKQVYEVLGEHDFTYQAEYRCKCWLLNYEGMVFVVVSANGRGTTVECAPAATVEQIKNFLTEFVDELVKIGDTQVQGSMFLLKPIKHSIFSR